MPNENDNNNLPDLSIEEINDLYSDIIEFPDDMIPNFQLAKSKPFPNVEFGALC